jgi:2-methylcitrate dehydratase PrpD
MSWEYSVSIPERRASIDRPVVVAALARSAVSARSEILAPGVLLAARRALVDWSAAALGGSRDPSVRALGDALGANTGKSRLVGRRRRADPSVAALINGTAAHTLEIDDVYDPGLFHPGAPIIAAALAVADVKHSSGEELLRAIAIGYEVGCRIAADLGPDHYRHWHTTGTAGALGAAAAVADLLGASEQETANALALAATMAAGLQQTFRRDARGKPLHAGHAAQSGVVAAVAARAGMTGAADTLEGAAGLAAATGVCTDWTRSRSSWDGDHAVEQVTIKAYPCCGHTFAAIDSALALRDVLLGSAADCIQVGDIAVVTYATAITVAGNPHPTSPAEARFSIPFAVASALRDGRITTATFDSVCAADPEQAALMDRVRMRVGSEYDAAFPSRRGAEIVATDYRGQMHRAVTPDRLGSPGNPLPPARVEAKYTEQATAVHGPEFAGRGLEELRNVALIANIGSVEAL